MPEKSFWESRWSQGRIGFHQGHPNPALVEHHDRFTGGAARTILAPLCGKAVDLAWLAERGHRVIGVEWVEQAAEEFFDEWGHAPDVDEGPIGPRYEAQNVVIHVGSMFDVGAEVVENATHVWDRAAMIALSPEERSRYAEHLARVLPGGATSLVVTLAYDQSKVGGPPFSVPLSELQERYASLADVEVLGQVDIEDIPPGFKAAGIDSAEHLVALLRFRG